MIAVAGGILIVIAIIWAFWFGAALFMAGGPTGSLGGLILVIVSVAVLAIIF